MTVKRFRRINKGKIYLKLGNNLMLKKYNVYSLIKPSSSSLEKIFQSNGNEILMRRDWHRIFIRYVYPYLF